VFKSNCVIRKTIVAHFLNRFTSKQKIRIFLLLDYVFYNILYIILATPMIKIPPNRLYRIIICFVIFLVISCVLNKLISFNRTQSHICSHLCSHSSILTQDTLRFDSSYTIRHFPQFVCPQNFRNLADWVYGWPDQFLEHIQITTNQGEEIAPCLPSGSIIYVRIWVINEFFTQVYPHLQNDFVLITGEGDMSSPTHMEYLERSDSKIIHWFGQNGQYDTSRTKKFTHIPLGSLFILISHTVV
jgi:hypothetical protein